MAARVVVWLLIAATFAWAEDPYAARWTELRERIAAGGDVGELLRQWEPRAPAARGVTERPARTGRAVAGMPDASRDRVRVAACQAGVRPSLALAIVEHETGFDNRARGQKGEIGAGQIMPSTADTFGFDKSRLAADYDYNVRSSVAIMRYLLDYFNGDEASVIRGYNGGPGWKSAGPVAAGQIESYAASVGQLEKKYVPVRCG